MIGRGITLKDVRGTEIKPGVKVAYNISGDVALGKVLGLTHGVRAPVKVQLLHPAAGHGVSHVSTVKHARSLLVLLPEDNV